jgi:hypothetical protein
VSWASYGDDWTGRPVWDGVDYATRWHYLAMVERCVRDRRWDGVLPLQAALRCSDVTNPVACIAELVRIQMVVTTETTITIVFIEEHIPPKKSRPEVLLPRKRKNLADFYERKCERGEHNSRCPRTCPDREGKPDGKPASPGTGTGTGKSALRDQPHEPESDDPWPSSVVSL